MKCIIILSISMLFSVNVFSDTSGKGKITFTQGHVSPNCRTVEHKANGGAVKYFRIAEIEGSDDISSIVLAALMANRDVDIYYDPAQTSGCGNEPKILYVTVY
jgi:hypothetical protein